MDIQGLLAQTAPFLIRIGGAILLLVVGYLIAKLLGNLVRDWLKATKLDNKIAHWFGGESAAKVKVEEWVGTAVFALLMLFVLIAFFQILDLDLVTTPLNNLLVPIFAFAPRILSAAFLLFAAWAIATIVKMLLSGLMDRLTVDEKINSRLGLEGDDQINLSNSVIEILYWLIFLIFLPMILDALNMQGLLEPVQGMLDSFLGFLPNLFGAVVIFFVGWLIARVVQRIASSFLAAAGADNLSERMGISKALGEQKLSTSIGLIIYVLILLPVIISALDALQLSAITGPASAMLNNILGAIPMIFGAALVLGIAYVIGKIASGLVVNLLEGVGFDNILDKVGMSKMVGQDGRSPSAVVGWLVMAGFIFFALIESTELLGFSSVALILAQFLVFAGQIVLGLIILGIGMYLANLAANAVQSSEMKQSSVVAMVVRWAILILTGAMALGQMGLATDIINLAFGLLLGAVAVGAALAFGLGGREIAARKLAEWVDGMDDKK